MSSILFPTTSPDYDSDVLTEVVETTEETHNVTVYNDDVNSFDHVIELLMHYCGHERHQAEQCAMFIHTKGKYAVKHGERGAMDALADALCVNGLDARVQSNL